MEELKRCPFCGKKPRYYEIPPHTHHLANWMPDHKGSFIIECGLCGIGMIRESKQEVFDAWNTRAEGK